MANRLADSLSPYLLQHAENPVAWQEWGQDAFAEAHRRNVPVLLSVGYAACHWCHVMAHESFEDDEVARVLNGGFVPVKVDREERPDVDAVYMSATTAMTGHGGWPMTCLLTPDGEPFWCGTYLPQAQFLQLLRAAATAWTEREAEVRAGGAHVVATLRQAEEHSTDRAAAPLEQEDLAGILERLATSFDPEHGGFGTAPKFPPSMVVAFLLHHGVRTGQDRAVQMGATTLRAMARSGMYDQIGGGFARYAVDAGWVVPHFEKMLYDNALLLRVYTDWWRCSDGADRELAERVVRECVDWLLRELWTPEAAFAASLDADTMVEGRSVEGATYVWTPEQLEQVLGARDGSRAAALLRVTTDGTFEHGASTLQLPRDPDDAAWWQGTRDKLEVARSLRPQPARDDKVVTAWNGLTIAALAEAGSHLDEPDWVDVAARCADLLLRTHLVDGRLRRVSLAGRVGQAEGVAEDYGNLTDGLLALHAATGEARWLEAAGELLTTAERLLGDERGGFTDTPTDRDELVLRPRSRGDNAEPSGQSALAVALMRYGTLAASAEHLERGRAALSPMAAVARSDPRFAGWALVGMDAVLAGPPLLTVHVGADVEPADLAPARRVRPGVLVQYLPHSVDPHRLSTVICRGTVCGLPAEGASALSRDSLALLAGSGPPR